MTDLEKANEYAEKKAIENNMPADSEVIQYMAKAYLAGLHEGQPKWHKPSEELPPYDEKVLVRVGEKTLIGLRDISDKCWCIGDFFDTILSNKQITAWTEIPQFKE